MTHQLNSQFVESVKMVTGVNNPEQINKDRLNELVEQFFEDKQLIVKTTIEQVIKTWDKRKNNALSIAEYFFSNEKIHDDVRWILYPSFWGVMIHNSKDRAISFPVVDDLEEIMYVIFHELLHVFFFEYVFFKYSKKIDAVTPKTIIKCSEIVNDIILGQNDITSVASYKHHSYQNKNDFKKAIQLWEVHKSIDEVIEYFLFDKK